MDRQLGLKGLDPTPGGHQLRSFAGAESGLLAPVDPFLAPPGVERLVADAEISGDVDDLAASGQQIEGTTAELGGVTGLSGRPSIGLDDVDSDIIEHDQGNVHGGQGGVERDPGGSV